MSFDLRADIDAIDQQRGEGRVKEPGYGLFWFRLLFAFRL